MGIRLVESGRARAQATPAALAETRSRRDLFRQTCTVLLEVAPGWCEGDATVVIATPPLTGADVQSTFDEVSEKYRVSGVALHLEEDGGKVRAIFEHSPRRRSDAAPRRVGSRGKPGGGDEAA